MANITNVNNYSGAGGASMRDHDPFQGHDVHVVASGYAGPTNVADGDEAKIPNAFTDIMFKIVNQTETYLPLFTKVPRYLDGEVIIVWSCSAGSLSLDFIAQTFGASFARGISAGRTARIRRSNRFKLTFKLDPGETYTDESGFRNPLLLDANGQQAGRSGQQMSLLYCRCDTLSFGVGAGKGYAVQSWQGTAEGVTMPQDITTTINAVHATGFQG